MAQEYAGLTNGPEQAHLNFRFQINGTSDPDNIVPSKQGVTDIVRDSTGLFSITLAKKYPTMINCLVQVQLTAVADAQAFVGHVVSYTASTGVLVVRTCEVDGDGIPVADDPADNYWVHVSAVFCRFSNLAPSGSI